MEVIKANCEFDQIVHLNVRDDADRSRQRLLCLLPCQGHLSIFVAAPQFPNKLFVVGDLLLESLRSASLLLALPLLLELVDQLVHFHLMAMISITFEN